MQVPGVPYLYNTHTTKSTAVVLVLDRLTSRVVETCRSFVVDHIEPPVASDCSITCVVSEPLTPRSIHLLLWDCRYILNDDIAHIPLAFRSSVYPAGAAVRVCSLDAFMVEITSSQSFTEPFESTSSAYQWMILFPVPEPLRARNDVHTVKCLSQYIK